MSKFKKGDKVRVINVDDDDLSNGVDIDEVGVVQDDLSDVPYVWFPILDDYWAMCQDDLELITEEEHENTI